MTGYNNQTADDGSRFEVVFLADGNAVGQAVELNSTSLTARLYDEDLAGKAGSMVGFIFIIRVHMAHRYRMVAALRSSF